MGVDNPQAFPTSSYNPGMTLRDYFAGQVLAGAAALPWGSADYENRARVAYAQADAMLAARKGEK